MEGIQTFKGSWSWPWPWIRPYGIPSCITHRPLPAYQISLRSEEKFFRRSPLRFWSSSESRDTKTRTNHSSTSTYIPNFIEIEETFCGRTDGGTDGRTGGRTDGRTFSPSNIIRSTFGSQPNLKKIAADKNILQISSIEDVDCWSTGIRGLMRGMATLPQGNQELLVVRDKIGRSPGEPG